MKRRPPTPARKSPLASGPPVVLTAALALALLLRSPGALAIDSYRYLHVGIETPWLIFLFLLGTVFVPFVLMGVLIWRRSDPKSKPKPKPPEKSTDE